MADSVQKRIQDLEISIKEFQLGVKDVVENGEKAKKTYRELLSEFKKLTSTAENLAASSKKSFSQTKNNSQYLSFLTKVNTGLGNISTSYKALEKNEKNSLNKRQEIQKKWDDRKFKRTLARLKKEQDDRIAAEIKVQKRRESIQKKWNDRKRRRDNAASKRRSRERLAEERKVQRQLESTAKKQDFKGGFGGQLTPRAIGGALGSLTKYLGLYQLINAAQRVFTELTVGSIKQSLEFEKALANLGAVAGASAKDVEILGNNALEVAGKTKFASQEIISLQTELSKLGFTSKEVIASTEAIAFTAQALGSPLEATAQQVGKIINQFGLLIEQSGFVGDVLVTTINNSALSMDSFATAIQYVGPIAKNLGLSLEQTAGAMAVLADNGFTASRVGTGLRGIFTELGKTSADVESSLKSLAEQNISLSEAVDLVGKRNAAQLITLLQNIEAIDDSTTKYYQQGKAFESAAKQADTLNGQIELLTANFREYQKEIGDSIINTKLLLGVMDLFFPKASQTSRAFKNINEVGFNAFNKGAKEVANGFDAMIVATELAGVSIEDYERAFETLQAVNTSVFKSLGLQTDLFLFKERALTSEIIGLINALEKESEEMKKNTAIKAGEASSTNAYSESVKTLTSNFENNINVNSEAASLFKEIGDQIGYDQQQIERLNGEIKINNSILKTNKNLNESEKEALIDKNEELALSIVQYKSSTKVMVGYQDQLTNVTLSTEQLAATFEKINNDALKAEAKQVKEQIKIIKEGTDNRISAANERAKIETELANTKEEEAYIESERIAFISNAYKKQAADIRDLSEAYVSQADVIEDAAKSSDKLAQILTSDIIDDVKNAITEYGEEIETIRDKFANAGLGPKEFKLAVEAQEVALRANIDAFTDLIELTPELKTFFNNLINATIGAAQLGELGDKIAGIEEETSKLIETINEQAKIDTQIASSKAEANAIEAKRLKDVSDAYSTQEVAIVALSSVYENQRVAIDAVADSSNELSQILTSDIISNVVDTVGSYTTEVIALNKAFDDGKISQEQLTQGFEDQEKALIENVEAFSSLGALSPEIEAFFKKLIADALAAKNELAGLDADGNAKKLKQKLQEGLQGVDWGSVITEAADATAQAIGEFNDVALENTKSQAEQELDVLKNKFALEEEILNSQLNNQLITESQFRKKKAELRKAEIAAENEIEKKLFEAQKKRDKQQATSDYLVALANIIPSLIKTGTADPIALQIKAAITGALATGSYAASLAAIGKRKFYKKFADGGVVNGPSHEEGGVPFSVQGNGGYEMEGGEYVINKRATSMHKDLLDRINQSGKTRPQVGKVNFAQGGLVSSPVNESVDYLKAIAEATTSTAIGVSKPVRAYVADKDLQTNSTERRIRDRNDRI